MIWDSLVSLARTTDLILNPYKYFVCVDERENLKSISEYVIFLISYVDDIEEKANRLKGKIRMIANEAETIMEHFMSVQIQRHRQRVAESIFESEYKGFAQKLKKVIEEMGFIAGELMDDRPGMLPCPVSSSNFAPTSIKDDIVIGLDADLSIIKERLFGASSKREVIPIVGMAGIGKTTLIRNAYHDPLIMGRFDIRVWVTVSQHYSAQKMLLGLLDSMKLMEKQTLELSNELTIEDMVQKVYQNLKGRRYLLVLDDIWSTDAWDYVRIMLPDDNNGSRIVLTTRLSNLAVYADSCSPLHEMQLMDDNLSWRLLKLKVFKNGQDCSPKLEKEGREMAQRCRGLPLAIVLLAGILSVDKSGPSWEKIAENITSVVDGPLNEILSLSYMHLPHHLKPCFLFMGGYPEDYELRVSRLIKLWVAEGFLKHIGEEEAEEYLEDLVKRSLVLVTSRKSNGKIKSCSLHDLVREMCVRKAHEQKFLLNAIGSILPLESVAARESKIEERRVSISDLQHLNHLAPTIRTIRTVISFLEDNPFSSHSSYSPLLEFVKDFELIRVLDLVKHVWALPFEVFELFHLRYLAFFHHIRIPAAISKLENLQTLINYPVSRSEDDFYYCLPSEIWKMPQLRHFASHYAFELPDPPEYGSTLPLENLQTLSVIINLVCRVTIIQMIPNLKKLGLAYRNNQYYHLDNLVHLHQLEKLKVTGYRDFSWRKQNLAFPSALKKLTLVRGLLPWEKMTIIGSLPNLEVLKLRNFACDGDTWETIDGEFPRLKFLLIEKSHLRFWITDSSHLPTLKCLVLHECQYLNEIPEDIGDIPTLELIEVDDVNQSLVESARQIKENNQDNGDDTLQVRCIHFDQCRNT